MLDQAGSRLYLLGVVSFVSACRPLKLGKLGSDIIQDVWGVISATVSFMHTYATATNSITITSTTSHSGDIP